MIPKYTWVALLVHLGHSHLTFVKKNSEEIPNVFEKERKKGRKERSKGEREGEQGLPPLPRALGLGEDHVKAEVQP